MVDPVHQEHDHGDDGPQGRVVEGPLIQGFVVLPLARGDAVVLLALFAL